MFIPGLQCLAKVDIERMAPFDLEAVTLLDRPSRPGVPAGRWRAVVAGSSRTPNRRVGGSSELHLVIFARKLPTAWTRRDPAGMFLPALAGHRKVSQVSFGEFVQITASVDAQPRNHPRSDTRRHLLDEAERGRSRRTGSDRVAAHCRSGRMLKSSQNLMFRDTSSPDPSAASRSPLRRRDARTRMSPGPPRRDTREGAQRRRRPPAVRQTRSYDAGVRHD